MSDKPNYVTCRCRHCDGHIEFDASDFAKGEGRPIECPHCHLETVLFVPQKPPEVPPPKLPVVPAKVNLRTCADCGKDVSIHAESCPHCGALLVRKKKHGVFYYVFWGVVSLIVTCMILGMLALFLPVFIVGFNQGREAAKARMQAPATTNSLTTGGTPAANSAQTEKQDYIKNYVELYDFAARYYDSVLDGRIPGVNFKIRNDGTRTLKEIEVTVYFLDGLGRVIWEERYYPVVNTEFGVGNTAPLKPGYIWQGERDHFLTAKKVPSEWSEGKATVKITNIEFSD